MAFVLDVFVWSPTLSKILMGTFRDSCSQTESRVGEDGIASVEQCQQYLDKVLVPHL